MDSFISLFDPGMSDEPTTTVSTVTSPVVECGSSVSKPSGSKFGASNFNNNNEGERNSSIQDLPPEPQLGNIEYKLKLVNPSRQRFEHLVTQMKWRLREGHGEAIYEIGVEDCGRLRGLSAEEMNASLSTLKEMANKLGATSSLLRETVVIDGVPERKIQRKTVRTVLIRKVPDDQPSIDLRVAVMGNENAGKSTVLGVLTQGELDDGRGRARLNMFRHLHEVQTGRTSSISHEIVGFDSQGRIINYQEGSPETICELSTKLVTLIDLAGHPKYLRTTLHGITGYSPHYIFFVISASNGFTKMTKEHLTLAVALQISLVVIVSKTDLVTEEKLEQTINDVMEHLTDMKKEPVTVQSEDDVITFVGNQQHEGEVPILCISSLTGYGLNLVTKLLHLLPPGLNSKERDRLEKELPVFQVDETFRIPQKGTILGGLLKQGIVKERTSMLLGPFYDGTFQPVCINSIRRHKTPCLVAKASQSVSLSLDSDIAGLRKGMVLISPLLAPKATFYFQASIFVLYHSTAISKGFQTTVHIGNVRQTVKIEQILSVNRISTNDRALVVFRFIKHPEYIQVGSRLLFREGSTKGFGTVTDVYPFEAPKF